MKYAEWMAKVPCEITNDPIWDLEVYRLALFVADLGRHDAKALGRAPMMRDIAGQLQRALDSISANLTEGYSRSKGADRARFMEIALGSARESRDWYFKAREELRAEVVQHRLALLTRVIAMLASMIRHQRDHAIREQEARYERQDTLLETDVPLAT
jgi:four helix bundle protein